MRKVMGWLISLAVLLVSLSFLMWIFQSRFIYFPDMKITHDPSDAGLKFEDVFLKTSDGVSIHGWYVGNEKARDVLLFCHGNGGNISGRVGLVRDFYDIGLSVFIFDYRGYGRSEGSPSEKGTYRDVEAAWDWLSKEKKYKNSNILVIGRSLGAAVASYIALKNRPKGLILDSAFISVPAMAREQFPFLPVFLLPIHQYSNAERIKRVKCPVLIIHSRDDELIPFKHGKNLFDMANEPKSFLEIRGTHNEGYWASQKEYLSALRKFMAEI